MNWRKVNNLGQMIWRSDEPEDTLPGTSYRKISGLARENKRGSGTYVFRKSRAMN
jgi:hypothetical protein